MPIKPDLNKQINRNALEFQKCTVVMKGKGGWQGLKDWERLRPTALAMVKGKFRDHLVVKSDAAEAFLSSRQWGQQFWRIVPSVPSWPTGKCLVEVRPQGTGIYQEQQAMENAAMTLRYGVPRWSGYMANMLRSFLVRGTEYMCSKTIKQAITSGRARTVFLKR